MEEIWKNIKGFDGYKISNKGRIFSLKANIMLIILNGALIYIT